MSDQVAKPDGKSILEQGLQELKTDLAQLRPGVKRALIVTVDKQSGEFRMGLIARGRDGRDWAVKADLGYAKDKGTMFRAAGVWEF